MDEPALNAAMDQLRACADDARVSRRCTAPSTRASWRYLTRMTGLEPRPRATWSQETFLRMHRARATFARGGAVLPGLRHRAQRAPRSRPRRAPRETERLPSDPGAEPPNAAARDAEAARDRGPGRARGGAGAGALAGGAARRVHPDPVRGPERAGRGRGAGDDADGGEAPRRSAPTRRCGGARRSQAARPRRNPGGAEEEKKNAPPRQGARGRPGRCQCRPRSATC